jgi:hypothetical protein
MLRRIRFFARKDQPSKTSGDPSRFVTDPDDPWFPQPKRSVEEKPAPDRFLTEEEKRGDTIALVQATRPKRSDEARSAPPPS